LTLHGTTRIYGCCKLTPQFEPGFRVEIKRLRKGFNSIKGSASGKETVACQCLSLGNPAQISGEPRKSNRNMRQSEKLQALTWGFMKETRPAITSKAQTFTLWRETGRIRNTGPFPVRSSASLRITSGMSRSMEGDNSQRGLDAEARKMAVPPPKAISRSLIQPSSS
jgi:hypothetical protein